MQTMDEKSLYSGVTVIILTKEDVKTFAWLGLSVVVPISGVKYFQILPQSILLGQKTSERFKWAGYDQCSYKRGSISLSPSIPTAWPIRCRSTNCYFSCLVRHTNPLLQASFTIPLTLPETKSKQYPSSSGSAAGWL